VRHGEIWWTHIGGKRRPAVVLTRDRVLPLLSSVTVAPVTRTVRGIPSEVVLDSADGMRDRCAVSLDNIETISKSDLHRRITTLSADRLEDICEALKYALAC